MELCRFQVEEQAKHFRSPEPRLVADRGAQIDIDDVTEFSIEPGLFLVGELGVQLAPHRQLTQCA